MRLHEAKHARAAKRAEIQAKKAELRTLKGVLRQKAENLPDGEDLATDDVSQLDTLQAAVDSLEAEAESLDTRIARLEQLMDADAQTAAEDEVVVGDMEASFRGGVQRGVGGPGPSGARLLTPHGLGEPARRNEKGFFVARMMIAKAFMKTLEMSRAEACAAIERRFGDTNVAKALNTAGTGTGGALIPQDYVMEIIELLRATAVVRSMRPEIREMPRGNLTIPRLASAATASYQGELDQVSSSQQGFDVVQLNAKKLTSLVPVTNDLIRRTPMNVEQIIRDDLVLVTALREDLAFLLADGSLGQPVGFLNQCAAAAKLSVNVFPALDNATISGVVIGVANAMMLTLKNAMSRMIRPGWIMSPSTEFFLRGLRDQVGGFLYRDEMRQGTWENLPYKVTQQFPTNIVVGGTANGSYLMLIDFADVIVADTLNYELDISDQGTYIVGGTTVSAFQMDQTLFRVIQEHDMALRHQASVAIAVLPGWVPAGYSGFSGGQSYYVQAPTGDMSAAPSTWGSAAPTGSNNPANISANVSGGQLPGRP